MSDAALSLLVLAVVVVLFVSNRLPVEVVAVGSAVALLGLGVLDLDQALAGFADPTVVLIAALFVVSEGLDATGVTAWVGDQLVARTGGGPRRIVVLVMLLVAGVTALINLNGAVAALLPMVLVLAVRRGVAPSRLLLPLAFAGSAGSLLLLTGSPVNVIVAEAAADAGVGRIGFAEFALIGAPLLAGTVLMIAVLGDRLLPERPGRTGRDLSGHARTLAQQYDLDRVVHLRIPRDSALVGHPRATGAPSGFAGVSVVTISRGAAAEPTSEGRFAPGDLLSVVGDPEQIERLGERYDLDVEATLEGPEVAERLIHRGGGVIEVVIPPRSDLVGVGVRPGHVLQGGVGAGSLIVLAIQRQGRTMGGEPTVLQAGDLLLVEGPWSALDAAIVDADVLVVDAPDLVRRRAVPLGMRSRWAIGTLLGMVVLLVTGIVEPVVATLLAAGTMVVGGAITIQQAHRRISWTTVLLVAGMIPLATAIRESGAGEGVADLIVGAVGDAGPRALLVALFLLTAAFGQMISNTATALIVIPIAVSAAEQVGASPKPMLLAVCVAAAASFLTPVATPANMMVMGPGGYRFGDYWRLGLPLLVMFFVVSFLVIPLLWPF